MKTLLAYTVFFVTLLLGSSYAQAQYKVRGTVYDSSRHYRIQAVTVMSTGGSFAITDSVGRYQIGVGEKDSVWFSYLGKSTPKYAVLKMPDVTQFDIALQLKSVVMEEVKIKSRSYRMDSIQNRMDYAKAFNYRKVSFSSMTSIGPGGAAFDLQEIIRLFQFRKNKSMLAFQRRLLEQEQEKYIDHRFNKALVRKLTGLDGEQLNQFMARYRPGYEFTMGTNDYDFQLYIKSAAAQFIRTF